MTARGLPVRGPVRGFTIAEAAIVLLIVGLLLGGVIATFLQQQVVQEAADTQRRLEMAREAVIGFAIANGRLPCPAAPAATGVEVFVPVVAPVAVEVRCANPLNGFLPALTLGLGPTDANGYLVDAWGNPVRYAVTQWWSAVPPATPFNPPPNPVNCPPVAPATPPVNPGPLDFAQCPAFTTSGAMKGVGFAALPAPPFYPGLLRICNAAACGVPPAPTVQQTFYAPAVIFSTGRNFNRQKNLAGPIDSPDEEENAHKASAADVIFVYRPPAASSEMATTVQFDDQVIWISPNVLYNRLIAAGAL